MAIPLGAGDHTPIQPGTAWQGSIPIVEAVAVSLSVDEEEVLRILAARLIAEEPALASTAVFGEKVRSGHLDGPSLLIGDHREIALIQPGTAELYEYRISFLAREGDIVLVDGHRDLDFEAYRGERLGLGGMEVIELSRGASLLPLAKRCCLDKAAMKHVVERARDAGGLTVLPYIGTGSGWVLGGLVAEMAGVPVRVAAPPPRLTRRVNDKLWFARRVNEVLGAGARPPLKSAYGPSALAANLAHMARRYERVAVKVPDSAGSAGNICLPSEQIGGYSLEELRSYLLRLLQGLGWRNNFPLLVEVWDCSVLANPSTQVWVPLEAQGPPIVEGIFEQVVEGTAGRFIGSVPTTLPASWSQRVAREAVLLARLFQRLGYYGRCSFDAVVSGKVFDHAELHWIECNGRWGGVSIPMTLTNRLTGDWSKHPFTVVQHSQVAFRPRRFSEVTRMLGDRLYSHDEDAHGVVVLAPLGLTRGAFIDLLAIADSVESAKALAYGATLDLMGVA